ncbi:S-methyl-5-thioribose-1-phosphate isomerase [Coemansia biformis]|uniref:Methylthioribose-1-phosphate isomerase n=1 Tax=Coemansia biformis TaxID=1286918 RepID=A0A9W7YGA8_9FUNG|nr:S-methyl-5-thioribose-1-phosphate isomerase [Coemansia biformis]
MAAAGTLDCLQAIKWERPRLTILNQLLLPHRREYVEIATSEQAHHAIVSMQTRGAPAIAMVAALALAAEVSGLLFASNDEAREHIRGRLEYLKTSRPTAVNLFEAAGRLRAVVDEADGDVVKAYVDAAERMLEKDVADNKAIGKWGSAFLSEIDGDKVLTHCNTGALATAGHGTALGIVRNMWQDGQLGHVFFTETRPYNQGARLTAFELVSEGIPATLVCDSAVSALMAKDRDVKAVVVGADRVAANGDTANKVGTYQLAIAARFHGRAFIVAAPSTSIDLGMRDGSGIVVEERSPAEITTASGFTVASVAGGSGLESETLQIAPSGVNAWNPSFDVTPAALITAIVTERGVFVKQPGADAFDLCAAPADV